MLEIDRMCRFFQICGPSAIDSFYLKDCQEKGGKKFRFKYCFGDPITCPFFPIRQQKEQKKIVT